MANAETAKQQLERAAAYVHKSLSEFVLGQALHAAEEVIQEHETLALSRDDVARTDLVITALRRSHDRAAFDCGKASLNEYLQQYASQDIKRRISKVFVASTPEAPQTVVGYYSLSAGGLKADALPERLRRKLPRWRLSGTADPAGMSHRPDIRNGCGRTRDGRRPVQRPSGLRPGRGCI